MRKQVFAGDDRALQGNWIFKEVTALLDAKKSIVWRLISSYHIVDTRFTITSNGCIS